MQFSETVNALTNLEGRRALTSMYNVFETLYDENSSVQRIKKLLYENQARFAMLTGSGPAVFAAFDNIFWLEDAQEILEKEGIKCYQCDLINLDYEYLIPGRKPTAIVF